MENPHCIYKRSTAAKVRKLKSILIHPLSTNTSTLQIPLQLTLIHTFTIQIFNMSRLPPAEKLPLAIRKDSK